jgi:hypothetical protein
VPRGRQLRSESRRPLRQLRVEHAPRRIATPARLRFTPVARTRRSAKSSTCVSKSCAWSRARPCPTRN